MSARRWFLWHSWVGVTAGLLMFVICWSGTIAVFSEEIDWLLNPAERVEPAGEMRSWGDWQRAAERAYPQMRVDSINAPRNARSAAELWLETADGAVLRTYVNPYTAEVTGQTPYLNVQRFFRSLHMSLFDPGARGLGYYFVMLFSVLLAISLITALLFYRRWWRRFFDLHIHRNRRALWADLHKLAGLWSLWFIALMALTGLWYLVEFAGVDFDYPELQPVTRESQAVRLPLDELFARAQEAAPELRFDQMYLPGGYYGDVAVLHGQGDALLARSRANTVVVDAGSGLPGMVRTASDLGWPARWVDTADPLHFGNFAGLIGKAIWFAFGLVLSGLALTGAYLHVCRQRRSHAPAARRPLVVASFATTALVLAAACFGAAQEYQWYAPIPPAPAVWFFISAWVASTVAVLMAWMIKLK